MQLGRPLRHRHLRECTARARRTICLSCAALVGVTGVCAVDDVEQTLPCLLGTRNESCEVVSVRDGGYGAISVLFALLRCEREANAKAPPMVEARRRM